MPTSTLRCVFVQGDFTSLAESRIHPRTPQPRATFAFCDASPHQRFWKGPNRPAARLLDTERSEHFWYVTRHIYSARVLTRCPSDRLHRPWVRRQGLYALRTRGRHPRHDERLRSPDPRGHLLAAHLGVLRPLDVPHQRRSHLGRRCVIFHNSLCTINSSRLAGNITPGMIVAGVMPAILGSVVLTTVNTGLDSLIHQPLVA